MCHETMGGADIAPRVMSADYSADMPNIGMSAPANSRNNLASNFKYSITLFLFCWIPIGNFFHNRLTSPRYMDETVLPVAICHFEPL